MASCLAWGLGGGGAGITRDENGKVTSVSPPASDTGREQAGAHSQSDRSRSSVANPIEGCATVGAACSSGGRAGACSVWGECELAVGAPCPVNGQGICASCTCSVCGNGVREPGEVCDGSDLVGATCASLFVGFTGGTLGCSPDCRSFDTSLCTRPASGCGNAIIEAGEQCDPPFSNQGLNQCQALGIDGTCLDSCQCGGGA